MPNPLELSSTEDVAAYLGLRYDLEEPQRQADIDSNLQESLQSAREFLTDRMLESLQDEKTADLPSRLHRACKMVAARFFRREDSIYGVEAFGLAGELGGVLLADPTISELIGPYIRPRIGFIDLPDPTVNQRFIPSVERAPR